MAWRRIGPQLFHLWPEHVPALALFQGVQTQWRVGPAGATGLDYQGVRAAPAFRRLALADRERVFDDVCVMERAWLEWAAEKRASAMNAPL